jgi:hypothetical protein
MHTRVTIRNEVARENVDHSLISGCLTWGLTAIGRVCNVLEIKDAKSLRLKVHYVIGMACSILFTKNQLYLKLIEKFAKFVFLKPTFANMSGGGSSCDSGCQSQFLKDGGTCAAACG